MVPTVDVVAEENRAAVDIPEGWETFAAQVVRTPVSQYEVLQARERVSMQDAYARVRELTADLEAAYKVFDEALIAHLAVSPMGARRLGRLLGVSHAAAGYMLRIARGEVLPGRRRFGGAS